jgi:hypothetical protein
MTLWYLAKPGSMFSIAEFFNVAKLTVKNVTNQVIIKLCHLSPKLITLPNIQEALVIAE